MTTNTPTPAQALGEVMALSDDATSGEWVVEQSGENEYGVAVFVIHAPDAHIHCLAEFYGDPHDANLANAAVNFIRQHGQHFAGLSEENDRLHAELDFLTAQHERCTAYMVNHRGRLVYANSAMRDAYSDEHVRAEAAEARCAELEAEVERLRCSVSGWKLRCDQWQDQADSDRARVREADGLLRDARDSIVKTTMAAAGYVPEPEPGTIMHRVAAFLAANGGKNET